MSNNYLVDLLENNIKLLSPDFHKHLAFIINKIKYTPEKINSVEQVISAYE